MRLLETNRFTDDIQMEPVDSNILYYTLGSFTRFSRSLYHHAALNRPLVFDYRLIRVGRSSAEVQQTLFLDTKDMTSQADGTTFPRSQEDILVARSHLEVCVDGSTRKPTPIPVSDREAFSKILSKPDVFGESMEFPRTEIPTFEHEGCFTYTVQPRMSEMDNFFHINQGYYVEFANEAAARAATAGSYKSFGQGDICFRNLHTIISYYSAECFPSEKLKVSTWECPESRDSCLYFVMHKENGQLVYRAKFDYHPSECD